MLPSRTRFRAALTAALSRLPLATFHGVVQQETRKMFFGYPGGSHEPTDCWIYRRTGVDIEMRFGFYENFTPDDLICKVIANNEDFHDGSGASIQFHGDASTSDDRDNVALAHSGRVTIKTAISRADLVQAIQAVAPQADQALGGLDPKHGWPFWLGSTLDVPALLDRLFLYAYAVEQAKRSIRGESALPALPALRSSSAKTWIFQGNPDHFDVDRYIGATSLIRWTIRQRHLADRIDVGDRVFIWRAKGSGTMAGVVAAGYIVERPRMQPDHELAREFWGKVPEGEGLCVQIQLGRHAASATEVIRRDRLMDDPVLCDLRILKMANETNYLLDPEHGRRLEELWLNAERESSKPASHVEPDDLGATAPGPVRRSRVQGYEPDAAVRRAIELWAMDRAKAFYAPDFDVEDTSKHESYDLRCTRGKFEVRVEVKGSRGEATTVEVTIGEVENARGSGWRTDLFIVSGIVIARGEAGPTASGGIARRVEGWQAAPDTLKPIRFRCTVPLSSLEDI